MRTNYSHPIEQEIFEFKEKVERLIDELSEESYNQFESEIDDVTNALDNLCTGAVTVYGEDD